MNNITLLLYVYSLGNVIVVRSEQLGKAINKGVLNGRFNCGDYLRGLFADSNGLSHI